MHFQNMVLPPECIGVLGGGQLGRMLAMSARQMGYQVAILEPAHDCPAAAFANYHVKEAYNSHRGLQKLAELSSVITTEFENVPSESLSVLRALGAKIYPDEVALDIAQNRGKEKNFFNSIGLKTAKFKIINSVVDCSSIDNDLLPGILKTTTLGYDGKGQIRVSNQSELLEAYDKLGGEAILERLVQLDSECSVIIARNATGIACYPLIENHHKNGILDVSYIPASLSAKFTEKAQQAAIEIANKLDYIGILTIEFFITVDGELLVNEIAPRPHNSGHITIEAAVTSQFEQQLRAVCGLKLGSSELKQSGAMLNLLGDVWLNNPKAFELVANDEHAKFHWYDKQEPKSGRKMGHLSLTMPNRQLLESKIEHFKLQIMTFAD